MVKHLRQKVLEFLNKIPKGKVVTYKDLARKFNTSPRAIARILASNRETEKYACYKVVKSNGEVGGYNKGRRIKERLLKKEGVEIEKEKIKNFEKVRWKF